MIHLKKILWLRMILFLGMVKKESYILEKRNGFINKNIKGEDKIVLQKLIIQCGRIKTALKGVCIIGY